MKKPTVYLDTNVVSVLHYAGHDIAVIARQMATREWWEFERTHFTIWASSLTELELAQGVYPRQEECLRLVRRLKYVAMTGAVRSLAAELVDAGVIPNSKPADALQLALATIHQADYLLTWNYAHLANPVTQAKAERVMVKRKLRIPLLVSPESIPQVRFNQTIRKSASTKPFGGNPMTDSLIAESQKTRDQLVQRYGGLDGLCDKLEQMDRERKVLPEKALEPRPVKRCVIKRSGRARRS